MGSGLHTLPRLLFFRAYKLSSRPHEEYDWQGEAECHRDSRFRIQGSGAYLVPQGTAEKTAKDSQSRPIKP